MLHLSINLKWVLKLLMDEAKVKSLKSFLITLSSIKSELHKKLLLFAAATIISVCQTFPRQLRSYLLRRNRFANHPRGISGNARWQVLVPRFSRMDPCSWDPFRGPVPQHTNQEKRPRPLKGYGGMCFCSPIKLCGRPLSEWNKADKIMAAHIY